VWERKTIVYGVRRSGLLCVALTHLSLQFSIHLDPLSATQQDRSLASRLHPPQPQPSNR
jgi:hypothetical protein